jgi:hypothetical protein
MIPGIARWHPRTLLREENAGLLLDVVVLFGNLFVLHWAAEAFLTLVRRVDGGDRTALPVLAGFFLALFVLPPIGAVLKRWHYHRRRGGGPGNDPLDGAGGCLFNPIFYFCLQALIFSTVAAFFFQIEQPGSSADDVGVRFVTVIFAGIVLMITNTVLVYRYFSPPERPPRRAWMQHPATERVGDAFLYANMMCFQVFWNILGTMEIARVDSVGEFLARLGFLVFVALLLYFPPRMFYLAEDIHRPITWLTMLVANSPVMYRVIIGTGGG